MKNLTELIIEPSERFNDYYYSDTEFSQFIEFLPKMSEKLRYLSLYNLKV